MCNAPKPENVAAPAPESVAAPAPSPKGVAEFGKVPAPQVAKGTAEFTDVIISSARSPRHVCAACGQADATHHCARCKLTYCGAACQRKHWKSGGHKQRCHAIARDGLEQYFSDARARHAADRAVTSCLVISQSEKARCRICGDKGSLVRGCGCSNGGGFVHLQCLADAAAVEAGRDGPRHERLKAWYECPDCECEYGGVVQLAIARECWRRYVRRPPTMLQRVFAMNNVGNALASNGLHAEEIIWREAELATCVEHFVGNDNALLATQASLASCYARLGKMTQSLEMRRQIYARRRDVYGPLHRTAVAASEQLTVTLGEAGHVAEQRHVLRKTWPRARRVLGPAHVTTLKLGSNLARSLLAAGDAADDADVAEAEAILAECREHAIRELGSSDSGVRKIEALLGETRRHCLAD